MSRTLRLHRPSLTARAFRRAAALTLLGTAAAAASCDDTAGSAGTGGSGAGLSGPERICIDKTSLVGVPPAGLKIGFRVLDGFGEPVRALDTAGGKDLQIINDEKGTPFGQGNEGDSVSDVGVVDEVQLFSVLVLDMSDSIFNGGVVGDVVDGAQAFVQQVVTNAPAGFKHNVAIIAFGQPSLIELVQDFSQDPGTLNAALEALRTSESRGTTDLYEAYISGLNLVDSMGDEDAVVERFVVLLTDGTHEAGAGEALRALALAAKRESPANKYVIGIRGTYDTCGLEELAGAPPTCTGELYGCREGITCSPDTAPPPSCTQFQADVDPAALSSAFQKIGERAAGVARSNYVVGVCTPIALGGSSVTIRVDVDGAKDSEKLDYVVSELGLTGAIQNCNAQEVKDTDVTSQGGGGSGGGGGGGGG